MSLDSGNVVEIVVVSALLIYHAGKRWMEHREIMAGKRDPKDEQPDSPIHIDTRGK